MAGYLNEKIRSKKRSWSRLFVMIAFIMVLFFLVILLLTLNVVQQKESIPVRSHLMHSTVSADSKNADEAKLSALRRHHNFTHFASHNHTLLGDGIKSLWMVSGHSGAIIHPVSSLNNNGGEIIFLPSGSLVLLDSNMGSVETVSPGKSKRIRITFPFCGWISSFQSHATGIETETPILPIKKVRIEKDLSCRPSSFLHFADIQGSVMRMLF